MFFPVFFFILLQRKEVDKTVRSFLATVGQCKEGIEKGMKLSPCCSSQISMILEVVSCFSDGKDIKVYYLQRKKPLSGHTEP